MPRRHWIVLALALAPSVGIALAIVARRAAGPVSRDRVAVAVFTNRTGDSTLEPLGSMAADWITRGLDRLGGFDLAREQAALRPRSSYAVYTAGVLGLFSGHFHAGAPARGAARA